MKEVTRFVSVPSFSSSFMADIDLTRSHSLGRDGGREAVAHVAEHLSDDFGVDYQWEGDTLRFDGQGADGHIKVRDDAVRVVINLSFLLKAMQGRVETEAKRYLDEHLSSREDGG